jgi:hypothetical protein
MAQEVTCSIEAAVAVDTLVSGHCHDHIRRKSRSLLGWIILYCCNANVESVVHGHFCMTLERRTSNAIRYEKEWTC